MFLIIRNKWVFISITVLILVMAIFFIRDSGRKKEIIETASIGNMDQRIDQFHLIQFDDEDIVLEMEAERVDMPEGKEDADVHNIVIKYYKQESDAVKFSAEKGSYNLKKNIFTVNEEDGGVAVEIGDKIRMSLTQLLWSGDEREIHSRGRILIKGDKFILEGDDLIANLDREIYEIRKNIQATLWE